MQERVKYLVGEGSEYMWVSTFHSMCVRILRRDCDRIGYDSNFSILDGSDQLTVMKQVLKNLNIDPKQYNPRTMIAQIRDRKSTRLNSSHVAISYAVFCLKKKKK